MMKLVLLLALLTVSECDDSTVSVRTGEDVTLSCKYDINYYTPLSVCWGRGQLPNSGCNNQLISTDGHKVKEETRVSSRYKLLGQLDEGDVSLTILNVSETDAGQYGCRVEIPGLFNDDKHHFVLNVETAPRTTTSRTQNETSTEQTTAGYTAGQMSSTQLLLTSHTSNVERKESSGVSVVLLLVLFVLVALVIAGVALVIIASRRKRLNKMPQQQVNSSVLFSSTASTLHLQSGGLAVENIYQIDGGGDGGEYESCP
ncbi:T-cell immunoglobulin and mucin domain-containing protein 4 isoform X2 [Etheostoma spectabile]|uniref:Ig-like domain-containing protein n=1 Tax=Etheostoma spectabile TaxID=54343 RepID=A0A5J5CY96_9PERO|nr:T-cell immunoglobulin and mucin domain-containing protein 4-like isoform X2 [Etheostoma spectabile]KAA8586637.1 hypothetical protein FQN60_000473 [Etheostoma spectabile]